MSERSFLIVSFPNQHLAGGSTLVAAIDTVTGATVRLVPLPDPSGDHGFGATGLCLCGEGYLVCIQGKPSRIVRFTADWEVAGEITNPHFQALHGLHIDGDVLYAVATKHDAVASIRLADGSIRAWSIFRPRRTKDQYHMNDVCRAPDGRLLVSRFGMQTPNGLRSGEIVDVETGDVVFQGLREPHSLMFADGRLLVLESATGDLVEVPSDISRRRSAGARHVVRERFLGYVRGLWTDGRATAVGRSGFRSKSVSRVGYDRKPPIGAPGFDADSIGIAGVYYQAAGAEPFCFFDLSAFGGEVYAVIAIDERMPRHYEALCRRFDAAEGEGGASKPLVTLPQATPPTAG